MSGDPPGGDRSAFAERLRLQLQARYQGIDVEVDGARFALHLHGGGVDTTLPLAPLHHAVLRAPSETPAIIARYVASVDRQLTPRVATTVSLSRLLWCVRSRRSLEALSRAAELALRELPAGLAAFVAEELPGSIMRGVPREEWEAAGAGEDAVRAAASANTERRFARLAMRLREADRVPLDGWRMSADTLFQSTILVAPALLRALVERCAGPVLIGVPDRGVALAIPASAAGAQRFAQRLLREYRESMNPLSPAVLVADGEGLREEPRRRRATTAVMPWLEG